jgi:hypothetical protein
MLFECSQLLRKFTFLLLVLYPSVLWHFYSYLRTSSSLGISISQSVWRLDYGLDDRDSILGMVRDFFLFAIASIPVLGPTLPHSQLDTGCFLPKVSEANHSPPCSAEEYVELYVHSLHTSSWRGTLLLQFPLPLVVGIPQ